MSVAAGQRFKKSQRCPICGGADGDKRGSGKRCHGYLSEDGAYAHCSREEHAGGLSVEKGGTYAHRMAGPCKCGTTHGADERAWDGIEGAYDYRDERGILLFQVVRLIPKSFRQRKPNGDGTWDWRTSDVRRVLYRLPELIAAPRSAPVYIVEGEKDVDRLRALGVVATCNPMGAGKWSFVAELARATLRHRRVLVLADADKPGRDHAAEVVASLTESAAAVADLFPGEDSGRDVSDWLDAGNALASLPLPELPASMVTHTESFLPMPERLEGERDERAQNDKRALKYHQAFLDDALRALLPNDLVLLGAPTGLGKCLAPETPVLLYSGKVVCACDVKVGDLLMGPDSEPRRVLSTNVGRGAMFEIRPTKGSPWRCNDVHVLTLVHTTTGEVIDIPLDVYLGRSKNFRHLHKLFTTGVEFPRGKSPLPVPPYFLGLWFGDGAKGVRANGLLRVMVTTLDPEVVSECERVAAQFGLRVMPDENIGKCPSYRLANVRGAGNSLLRAMRELLGDGLEVPLSYLTASRRDRLEFLAGWLDSDGSHIDGCFDFVQKRDDWAQAVMFLARSLGMRATSYAKTINGQEYTRVTISGNTDEIPTRLSRKRAAPRAQIKNVCRTGFDVVPVGDGEYAGFTLSGDGRFLLGDFTVTHNTDLAMNIAATNAMLGRRVHYFALEAEPRELERRTKFAMISNLAYGRDDGQGRHPQASELNYADWLLGRCEHVAAAYNDQVDRVIRKMLGTLWTYYRGQVFGAQHLQKQILEIHKDTDLIIIDHLHYIDFDSDENEARAMGDTVKTIRDVSLRVGKPVILIAHLRKREQGSKRLIATLDDFHGSSNIVKICTQAITIERCHVVDPAAWYLAPTFMAVLKDRRAGAPPFVAVTNFDRRKKSYEQTYTLGRLARGGQEWEPVAFDDKPNWATRHKPLKQEGA